MGYPLAKSVLFLALMSDKSNFGSNALSRVITRLTVQVLCNALQQRIKSLYIDSLHIKENSLDLSYPVIVPGSQQ